MKSLKQLLQTWQNATADTNYPPPPAYSGSDIPVACLVDHTAHVVKHACFVARVRPTTDGHPHIPQAIANGATLIIGQRPPADLPAPIPPHVTYLQVSDTAETLAYLAAAWHGFPSKQLTVIGVTGTDGKTSTISILFELLRAHGLRTGLISTINAILGDQEESTGLHVTTPTAPDVQKYLRKMVDAGLTHCILETTSHGLAQHRVTAVDYDLAVVTNITSEHLDYHGTLEAYFTAKARLFEMAAQDSHYPLRLILNRDDTSYERLNAIRPDCVLDYGLQDRPEQPPALRATDIAYTAQSTNFTLHAPASNSAPISASLVGEFNIYNMLAAAATAHALNIPLPTIKQGLEAVALISGRMERIDEGQPFLVIVDFAHTTSSLANAITAARTMCASPASRIITLFGSAGKRDVIKRRTMAETAAQQSDLTILTAEDPRTDSLDEILETMAAGCLAYNGRENETFWRIKDRGRAIHFALSLATPQDIVLICGKGHEQSMCFGTTEYPWDDRLATRQALQAHLTQSPMPDLGLPTF